MNATFNLSTTPAPTSSEPNPLLKFNIFLYSVICVLGVTGNGLVIYATGFRMKKTVNTIWFLNLAVADCLFTFCLIFSIIYMSRNYQWPFGDFMCKFNILIIMLNMFASIFLLTAISLDRCLSAWLIEWVQNKRTVFKAKVFCVFIWLASVSCSIPYSIQREVIFNNSTNQTSCALKHGAQAYKQLTIFQFVAGFLIPFIIITCSYVAIGIRVRRLRQKTLKPLKTILTVILAFFFCWLPFYIYVFLYLQLHETSGNYAEADIEDLRNFLEAIGSLLLSLAYFNSCLNPILYMCMCTEFKTKVRESFFAVFESAFAEEHLNLLVSRYSMSHRKSQSRSLSPADTQSSGV